jgi:hypothetical protein
MLWNLEYNIYGSSEEKIQSYRVNTKSLRIRVSPVFLLSILKPGNFKQVFIKVYSFYKGVLW